MSIKFVILWIAVFAIGMKIILKTFKLKQSLLINLACPNKFIMIYNLWLQKSGCYDKKKNIQGVTFS